MLDLKWIRENPKDFDAGLARRGLPPMSADVLKLDEERRANTKALQDMQARRNAASKEIGKAKGKGGDPAKAEALMAEVAGLKDQIAAGEQRERELDEQIKTLLAGIPNMLSPDVPDGKDESENVELRRWGTPRDFTKEGFEPKQHFEIGEALGLMDFEAAAKISGARFTVLKGGLARLERALGQFMLDVQTGEHGYTEVNPPLLVKDDAVFGTAQLPKFSDDLFKTEIISDANFEKATKASISAIIDHLEQTDGKATKGQEKQNLIEKIANNASILKKFKEAIASEGRRWRSQPLKYRSRNLVRETIVPGD